MSINMQVSTKMKDLNTITYILIHSAFVEKCENIFNRLHCLNKSV